MERIKVRWQMSRAHATNNFCPRTFQGACRKRLTYICNQVLPASKHRSFCGIKAPQERGDIYVEKRQCDHRQRCGLKTRKGTACHRPASRKSGHCRFHGGTSSGARTKDGLAPISAANFRHGKFTKDKLEKCRANAANGREIREDLRQLERELIAGGTAPCHRCQRRHPIIGSLHCPTRRKKTTLVLPMTPATSGGSLCFRRHSTQNLM